MNRESHVWGAWERTDTGWERHCTDDGCDGRQVTTVQPGSDHPFDRAMDRLAGIDEP